MKRLATLLFFIFLLSGFTGYGQIFWTENFESGSSSGMTVNSYTGPNGPWMMTVLSTEGDAPNPWYVSCAEAGHLTGVCGSTCASSAGMGATLHIGSDASWSAGDMGASYDAGGLCSFGLYCVETDRRAESPTINCTGKTNITLSFYYIENGQGSTDDGSVWYSPDNGTTWTLLVNTAKTTTCSSGQGKWDHYSMLLPTSADNNATVKLGFRWVNNDDAIGTDPSFAIDSVSLSVPPGPPAPVASFTVSATSVCQDSCLTFTSTSIGTIDSIKWSMPGVAITTPSVNPVSVCFPVPGTYTMHLYAYNSGGTDSTTHTITVIPHPHPVITRTGHTLSVTGSYSGYQWVLGTTTIIPGATNATYTATVSGTYTVVVDSAGCYGYATPYVYSNVGVSSINVSESSYWISQQSNEVTIYSSAPIEESLTITVYDATGRSVEHDEWPVGSTRKALSNASLPPGLYIIKLSNLNTSQVFKWMK